MLGATLAFPMKTSLRSSPRKRGFPRLSSRRRGSAGMSGVSGRELAQRASAGLSYARPMPLADPGEAQFHALFLCLVRSIGGADLLQHGGRQGADLLDELLQVFALHRRSGELQLLDLIEEVLVLHRCVKGAAQRSDAIGR